MAVNLGKNRLTLLTAYQDVIDETTDTDWALFTYEDDSDDLTLAASGGGGLPQITLTFDISRVMYGFCSLKEATAALPRYILINWVGDDVPDARKCACASHVATIADFFQGVDVIVNASSLDDIEPSAVGQRLNNGTVVVSSPVLNRLRTREEEHRDVGTVYEKTNAEVEMKKINREEFWEQAKHEEELRKEEERRKESEERQRYEEERMELERKEQENREKMYQEREREIEEHRKKMQEEEEARERLQNQTTVATEPSIEDLNLDKKESEVEEAKAIIAQRRANPRDFFKQKERAMTFSVDTSPVSTHRTGRLDSPFLKQQHHSPSSSDPPLLQTPPPHIQTQQLTAAGDNDTEVNTENNMAAVSSIPKIITTVIKEDVGGAREDMGGAREEDEHMCDLDQTTPVLESTPSKPVQSVAPQARDSSIFSETENLVNLWDSDVAPPTKPSNSSHSTDPVEPAGAGQPQPLLSFDELMDGTLCSGTGGEDEASSLVDVTASEHMTLSYQHALQHAEGEEPELDDGQLLMTNGETLVKEGTQVSEGYFSQSQEEEFVQSEDSSTKPAPVLYNKPPEIDITCWDTDPVVDEDD